MFLSKYTRIKTLAAVAAGSLAFGCGGDSGGGTSSTETGASGDNGDNAGTGDNTGGTNAPVVTLPVTFSPMYSAYDGEHTFKVPVHVDNAQGDLTVTTDPPDFVDADPAEFGVMLTMRQAGDAVVTFTDEVGNIGSAELHVREAGPNEHDLGAERYNNDVDAFTLPEGGFDFDGGPPMMGDIERDAQSACTFCHVPDGAVSGDTTQDVERIDIEHTPMQTAGFSDEEIMAIYTEGMKPEGSEFRVIPTLGGFEATIYASFHNWEVDEDVKIGLVTYLRGLEPKEQGEFDFGGLIPDDGPPGGGGNNNTGDNTGDNTSDAGATTGDDAGATGDDAGATGDDAGTETGDAGEETTE